MSTAVLISGHARTFAHCYATQRHHVYSRLDDPHFFVSVVDDAQAPEMHLLEAHYPGRVFIEKIAEQPTINIAGKPAPTDVGESQRHRLAVFAPYAVSASLQAILRQLWGLNRTWEFFQEIEAKRAGSANPECSKFDMVVRMRPDLSFQELGWAALEPLADQAFLPWWSRCGGINDRFGVMGVEAARQYFTTFTRWEKLVDDGCPLHPESLIATSLGAGGIDVSNTLQATFESLRIDGKRVPMVVYPGELAALIAATR